jgi:starch synthase
VIPLRILFLSSEVEPFAKTGGLADVTAALPSALAALGHDVRVALPLYQEVDRRRHRFEPTAVRVRVPLGDDTVEGRVWRSSRPESPVLVWAIEQPQLYDRASLYQVQGKDFSDNLTRFSFFAQAALRMLPSLNWQPQVVHAHDWQAALACAHLGMGPLGRERFFEGVRTVFTIHNLAYQGLFTAEQWPLTGLPAEAFRVEGLEFYGRINCLKGAVVSAGALTTVSPTYAREIQTAEFGCGLDGVLRERRESLVGVLNGIDPRGWDPRTDAFLAARYDARALEGKDACKEALQRRQGLAVRPALLIGMVQRLTEQKGIDIFMQALEALLALPVEIVLLGTGEPAYHQRLTDAAARFPGRLAVNLTFDNALAHQIEAGADAFLMPSRFEPCGLNQMYSMRYGTVPIVRRVGGLADTVTDATAEAVSEDGATGFVFDAYTPQALVEAVRRAVAAFGDRKAWERLMRAGMRQDFSWERSAQAYEAIYERALAGPRSAPVGSRR